MHRSRFASGRAALLGLALPWASLLVHALLAVALRVGPLEPMLAARASPIGSLVA